MTVQADDGASNRCDNVEAGGMSLYLVYTLKIEPKFC